MSESDTLAPIERASPRIIATERELARFAEPLIDAPILGIDGEGDGLYRYRTRLCVIQIAVGDDVAIIDPLAIEDLSALAPVLGPHGPVKVVHDVSFDAKMLATRGLVLANVRDTAVAARFLAEPSTGLGAMLQKYVGVEIDKDLQQADWGERPIGEERLAYLAGDVLHLAALGERLWERLRELDIVEEIDEETRYAIARALEPEPFKEPWTRIKGASDLDDAARGRLAELARVREDEAERRDVPPFRVVSNRTLLEAATKEPGSPGAVLAVRGMHKLGRGRVREALDRAASAPTPERPGHDAPPPAERARRKARERALTEWRKKEAELRGVDQQVVLPGHCLRDMSAIDGSDHETIARVAGLGEVRVSRYAAAITGVLRAAEAKG
ncbi:MAG: ribonuclease D [Sandaracinaceae bacterium]